MSIVAISETLGSLGNEIGRRLAESLGWGFADREIIAKAAERFGVDLAQVRHNAEEKPSLWERFTDGHRRFKGRDRERRREVHEGNVRYHVRYRDGDGGLRRLHLSVA